MRRTEELDRKAAALYDGGLGLADVGALLGLSAGTVHRILSERGIARRPRGRRWSARPAYKRGRKAA